MYVYCDFDNEDDITNINNTDNGSDSGNDNDKDHDNDNDTIIDFDNDSNSKSGYDNSKINYNDKETYSHIDTFSLFLNLITTIIIKQNKIRIRRWWSLPLMK